MGSKTISITIPMQLEKFLQKEADELGISRSRHIGNILLNYQERKQEPVNDCIHQEHGFCNEHNIKCVAPQKFAETCSEYKSNKG